MRTVKTLKRASEDQLLPPHDGGPKLRPHTIKGWWQVWSGGICIALLTPEDVAAIEDRVLR